MAPKTDRQLADALSSPDEGFYEDPDGFQDGGEAEGWSDEGPDSRETEGAPEPEGEPR